MLLSIVFCFIKINEFGICWNSFLQLLMLREIILHYLLPKYYYKKIISLILICFLYSSNCNKVVEFFEYFINYEDVFLFNKNHIYCKTIFEITDRFLTTSILLSVSFLCQYLWFSIVANFAVQTNLRVATLLLTTQGWKFSDF